MKISNKKTKIVATIGPSSDSKEQLKKLLKAGMNIVRMNFSHGDFAEHQAKIDNALLASKETGLPVAFMQDLAGPEIRTGDVPPNGLTLKKGKKIKLVSKPVMGTEAELYIDYKKLTDEVVVGNMVLIDDGKVQLKVVEVDKKNKTVTAVVTGAGTLKKAKRGINLPGVDLTLKSLTMKDKKDLAFGISNKVDFVAFSFVRTAKDVLELRKILDKAGLTETGIIPKIETRQAFENIDEIIKVSDAIMIARGDLAPETSYQEVPLMQKEMIQKCNDAGVPVITATQMIETMMDKPAPTRAEISDIANAVFDGTDAIMLSGETALGDYPIEAVDIMTDVVTEMEQSDMHPSGTYGMYACGTGAMVASGAVALADEADAGIIVCLTEFGAAARMVSRLKPDQTILALTPNDKTYQKLQLSYGVTPIKVAKKNNFDEALTEARKVLVKEKLAKKGELIVVVSGKPFKHTASPNLVMVAEL